MKRPKRRNPARVTPAAFKKTVRAWADKIGVQPNALCLQRMTTKWASCSSRGRVCFSVDLLRKPRRFQTAAIVHELLHLQVPNHGKLFRALLTAYVPDGDSIVKKKNGRTAMIAG